MVWRTSGNMKDLQLKKSPCRYLANNAFRYWLTVQVHLSFVRGHAEVQLGSHPIRTGLCWLSRPRRGMGHQRRERGRVVLQSRPAGLESFRRSWVERGAAAHWFGCRALHPLALCEGAADVGSPRSKRRVWSRDDGRSGQRRGF